MSGRSPSLYCLYTYINHHAQPPIITQHKQCNVNVFDVARVYGQHFQQSLKWINRVSLPCSWSAEQIKLFSLFPFAPENLRQEGFGCPVPRQPNHQSSTINHQSSIINQVLTHGIPPNFRDGVHIYRQPPSGQSLLEFIGSRNNVPMAFAAESLPALGQ